MEQVSMEPGEVKGKDTKKTPEWPEDHVGPSACTKVSGAEKLTAYVYILNGNPSRIKGLQGSNQTEQDRNPHDPFWNFVWRFDP